MSSYACITQRKRESGREEERQREAERGREKGGLVEREKGREGERSDARAHAP